MIERTFLTRLCPGRLFDQRDFVLSLDADQFSGKPALQAVAESLENERMSSNNERYYTNTGKSLLSL